MELIDRYLQAVRFWLPKAQRDDIIAELSEDLRSQVEAKQAELGRQTNEGELEAILLLRPYWTRLRAALRLGIDTAGSALVCGLLKSAILADILIPNVAPAQTLEVTNAINLWMARAFPAAVMVCLVLGVKL